eukprot:scaffold34082_cov62-Phaeocystis_antarctica.AAC.1
MTLDGGVLTDVLLTVSLFLRRQVNADFMCPVTFSFCPPPDRSVATLSKVRSVSRRRLRGCDSVVAARFAACAAPPTDIACAPRALCAACVHPPCVRPAFRSFLPRGQTLLRVAGRRTNVSSPPTSYLSPRTPYLQAILLCCALSA